MKVQTVGVVGGGAWGTALANAAAVAGRDVVLWMRDRLAARAMSEERENRPYLPGVRLHDRVRPTADAADLGGVEAALLVTPAQTIRAVLRELAPLLEGEAAIVSCAKGIERGTGSFLSEIIAETRPGSPVAVLSGPSFAADVARGLPTALTLACPDLDRAAALAAALSGPTLRVYHGEDLRGVEIGGAGKNVLAIACGVIAGRGLGESAKAALIARGFAELLRFARAYGGRAETLMGLSGLGDLVLTCASAQSRNFAFGERIGRGFSVNEAADGKLVEGAHTAGVLIALARVKEVEMPVSDAVDAILGGQMGVEDAIEALMSRPLRAEGER